MAATPNPYQPPEGNLALQGEQQYGVVRFFSPSSRIGRLRYLAHGFLAMLVIYLVMAISAGLALAVSPLFWAFFAVGYIAAFVFSFILMIQRLHDLNQPGWWSLLMMVPLANLILLVFLVFVPGTQGANNYGFQPPPNKVWHWILGLIGPILGIIVVIGVIVAVSIPAYQDYLERAGESDQYEEYYYDYDDEEDDE